MRADQVTRATALVQFGQIYSGILRLLLITVSAVLSGPAAIAEPTYLACAFERQDAALPLPEKIRLRLDKKDGHISRIVSREIFDSNASYAEGVVTWNEGWNPAIGDYASQFSLDQSNGSIRYTYYFYNPVGGLANYERITAYGSCKPTQKFKDADIDSSE